MSMRMAWFAALLAACSGGKNSDSETGVSDSADADTDADSDSDTDADADTDSCVALVDGKWDAGGAAFGMTMSATVTMDAAGCTFTLDNWDMYMGPMPDGGSVAGDQVTLSGSKYWKTCTGTANANGTSVDGVCSEDGAAFSMAVH